jgi:hypothetical protein
MELKPKNGGFHRPFGTTWFVIESLKGNGPAGSKKIKPDIGSPMTDIHHEYKSALHRAHAKDAVEREEERRIKRGKPAYTEKEYRERLQYYLERIPYKLHKMRYSSFTRYFGHLKRLGWVIESGYTEPSTIQDDYPPAPSRVYYRLTEAGWKATPEEISDPLMTLYHYSREKRSAKISRYIRY